MTVFEESVKLDIVIFSKKNELTINRDDERCKWHKDDPLFWIRIYTFQV